MPARKFTDNQEQEICHRYVAGESTGELGKTFGVYAATIHAILKRNGVERRSLSAALGGISPEIEPEICRRYEAGENTYELAKSLGVSQTTIWRALKRNGIDRRSFSEAQRYLPPEQEAEVCRRYEDGESTPELAKTFGVSEATIRTIRKRNGIDRRTIGESKRSLNPEQDAEVCSRYEDGESTIELGKAFGVTDSTIGRILKRNGIERRASGVEFGDSVQHILDGTGHHTHARECEFYVYELARYRDTHCKPGIAFDADLRADEEYGENALRLWFSTRAEALFLEQAVQDVTRGPGQCPEDLLDWGGATEVRAMPASDLELIVLCLADEMEELGVWDFAARYVPMTATQRVICQQRDMQEVAA